MTHIKWLTLFQIQKRLFDNVRCKQELLRRQRFPPSSWSMCHSSCISPSMRNKYESYYMTRQNWLIACVRFFLFTDKIMKSFREVWFSNNHLKPACKNCFGYKLNNDKQTSKNVNEKDGILIVNVSVEAFFRHCCRMAIRTMKV